MNNATTINSKPIPMPIEFTGDPISDDIRLVSTVWLRNMAAAMCDIRAGRKDAQRTEALHVDIKHAMRLLVTYARIYDVSPLDIYMDALKATRKQSKVLMKTEGDLLENPAPFAIVFAENVLKQVAKIQAGQAVVGQTAAA